MKCFLKVLLLLAAAGLLFTFAACDSIVGDDEDRSVETRVFRAQTYNGASVGTWYDVEAELLAKGEYCDVYVERGNNVTQNTAKAVAAEFDEKIFNQITTAFGPHRDVDGNGKLTLLLLDIVDGYVAPNGAYVQGYFDSTHMLDYSNSNKCDMIFLDVDPVVPGSSESYTTLAHEFQHLINYSRTFMEDGTSQDLWINEGLSSGAEYVYSREINQVRVNHFNNDPYGSIVYGNNFFVWNGYWESHYPSTVLDNYATVSLFFQWLRIHASNGTAIYKEILDSTNRDYQAVTAAAGNRIGSVYSTWGCLLETWYLANFRCQASGVYGYEGFITTSPVYFNNTDDQEWSLSPGEGIISALSATNGTVATWTPPTGSGTNVKYAGFDYTGTDVDRIPSFTNQYAIVYNANTRNTASDETGFVANIAAAPADNPVARSIQARIDANKTELPKKFAVGFHPGYGGSAETPEQKLLKNNAGFAPATTIQRKKGL